MITRDVLLKDNGYKYLPKSPSFLNSADGLFQKTVWCPEGKYKLYFLSVWEYDFRQFPDVRKDFSYDAEIHLYQNDGISIRVNCSLDQFKTLPEFEEYIHWVFNRLNCCADLHNN